MAAVVCVHGIGQQVSGNEVMLDAWLPALNSGLVLAGADRLTYGEVATGFYGDLFRPRGQVLSAPEPWYDADDVAPGLEQDLLTAWWEAAARTDPTVQIPDDQSLSRTPVSVQRMLEALADSRFFDRFWHRKCESGITPKISRYGPVADLPRRPRASSPVRAAPTAADPVPSARR